MTATEQLRALLDERGVEWTGSDTRTGFIVNGIDWEAYEHVVFGEPSGLLSIMTALTPEQAIEATLGRGTCKWEPADFITEGEWWNTSCGEAFTWEPYGTPNYCPNCGRRVEE